MEKTWSGQANGPRGRVAVNWPPRMRALGTRLMAVLVMVTLMLIGVTQGPSTASSAPSAGTGAGAYVQLTGSPGAPAIDPATGTLYVPVQCPQAYCPASAPGSAVDVISTAKCNVIDRSDCRVVATAPADGPLAVAVDQGTDTLYTANAGGTVSVIDGATCNASDASGCGKNLATFKLGGFLVNDVVNPLTDTLYVANLNSGVIMVGLAKCNAQVTSGCGRDVAVVKDAQGPAALDVDLASDTVYAANNGTGNNSGNGDTVSVIDGAACNGAHTSGCGLLPKTVTVGSGDEWLAVDQANGDVYVANTNDGTVSVIDEARCNAATSSACNTKPPAVFTGDSPVDVTVDPKLDTVFTLNQNDDTLSEMNTSWCSRTSPCPKQVLSMQATPDGPAGYNGFPNTAVLTPADNTAYIVNVGGGAVVSVVSVAGCNALDSSGCRVMAPTTPTPAYWAALDPSTGTLYASNAERPEIDVINAATCTASHLSACNPVATIPVKGPSDALGAIDDSTHTLYASDPSDGSVSIINTANCNASITAGCRGPHPTILIGPVAGSPVVNPGTATLYVPYGKLLNKVAVVGITTCNAQETSGCSSPHGTVTVGEGTHELAIDYATGTLYAASTYATISGPVTYDSTLQGTGGDRVYVVDGQSCNGSDLAGCARPPVTVKVGTYPYGLAVDDATHTLYVADNRDGDLPGEVTMVNTSICNGLVTRGCHQGFPTTYVGRSPRLAVVDQQRGLIYFTDRSSAAVSVLRTTNCNAQATSGCPALAPEIAVGSKPVGLAVDQSTGTVFVANTVSGTMSVLNAR